MSDLFKTLSTNYLFKYYIYIYIYIYIYKEDSALNNLQGLISPNECPGYDTKQSDDEAPVLELWRMLRTFSLPLLPGQLWPGVVAHLWVKYNSLIIY